MQNKKYKKENGFTLIELLAVIVILAVIALIATPLVLNIIERAEKGAFRDGVYGIMEAAEFQVILDGSKYPITYVFPEDSSRIKFKGTKPSEGYLQIVNEGKMKVALGNGRWCAVKAANDSQVTVKDGQCEKIELNRPILSGYGELNQKIPFNEPYTLPNVTATDSEGNKLNVITTIQKDGITVSTVDSSKVGSYTVTYTTEPDSQGNTATVTVIITVIKEETDTDKVIESGTKDGGLELIGDTYYYRGSDPKNWIRFNGAGGDNSLWRIISIENGMMKIIRSAAFQNAWDSTNDTDWARPATLNTYLNGSFKSNLPSVIQNNIQEGTFYIGKVNFSTSSNVATVRSEEKAVTWKGYVGLMNASDFAYASKDASCQTQPLDNTACTDSWLTTNTLWTINARSDTTNNVINVNNAGNLIGGNYARTTLHVKPVIYLKADVKIVSGDGSGNSPFLVQ